MDYQETSLIMDSEFEKIWKQLTGLHQRMPKDCARLMYRLGWTRKGFYDYQEEIRNLRAEEMIVFGDQLETMDHEDRMFEEGKAKFKGEVEIHEKRDNG